jgi:hypothetical protein
MTRRTSTLVLAGVLLLAGVLPDAAGQTRQMPPLAEVMTHAREGVVAFSDAVAAGDAARFVARFTPEAQAVFNPQRFRSLFGQFFDQKLSFPDAKTAAFHLIKPPAFGATGSLEVRGFFVQDSAKDNLIVFDASWRIAGAAWTMDGFGAKAFPKEGLPTNAQLEDLLQLVVAFNAALEGGDFAAVHARLHPDLKKSQSPEQMKTAFARFTRDKIFVPGMRAEQVFFEELPEIIGNVYLILKTYAPVGRGRLAVTLMCVKDGATWKAKDLRAFAE